MQMLFVGTHGSDDPTLAGLPMVSAQGALDAGHTPRVALVGEGVYLMKSEVADATVGVAWGNIGERIRDLAGKGVQFFV